MNPAAFTVKALINIIYIPLKIFIIDPFFTYSLKYPIIDLCLGNARSSHWIKVFMKSIGYTTIQHAKPDIPPDNKAAGIDGCLGS